MGTQIEDGELPEEGEIMEEEDEINVSEIVDLSSVAAKHTEKLMPSKKNFEIIPNSRLSSLHSYSKTQKFKDYDVKDLANDSVQEVILTSWVNGIHRKNKAGYTSPNDEIIDKKNTSQKTTEDMDYRKISSAEGEIIDDEDDYDNNLQLNKSKQLKLTLKIDDESIDQDQDIDMYEEDKDFRQHVLSGFSDTFGNRRRRKSVSPDSAKRKRNNFATTNFSGDEDSPSSSSPQHFNHDQFTGNYRGSTRGRQAFGYLHNLNNRLMQRWGEKTICKFFREGFCRDGDECAFSHNAADSHRKPELCKFYQHGFCKKGLNCLHFHGEYPCKAFHKGECSKEQCQYSHLPLNEFTQPIFDQMMKDEELASRISLPAHPLRRKVLIPQGPESSSETGHISPPSIVVPVLSSMPPSQVEEKVMAATGTYGFFNPITPVSISSSSSSHITLLPPIVSTVSSGAPVKAIIPPPVLLPVVPSPVSSTTSGIFSSPTLNKTISSVPTTRSNLQQQPKQVLGLFSLPTTSVSVISTSSGNTSLFSSSLLSSSNNSLNSTGILSYVKQDETKYNGSGFFDNHLLKNNSKNENLNLDSSGGFNINLMLERITQQVTGPPSSSDIMDDSPASPPNIFANSKATKVIPVVRAWKLIPVDAEISFDTSIDLNLIGQISSGSYRNDPRLRKLAEKQFDLVTKTLEKQSAAVAASVTPSKFEPQESSSNVNKSVFSESKLLDSRKLADPRKKAAPSNASFNKVNNFESSCIEQNAGFSSDELFQSMVQQQLKMVNQINAFNFDDIDRRVSDSTFSSNNTNKSNNFTSKNLNSLRLYGYGNDTNISSSSAENVKNDSSVNDSCFKSNQQQQQLMHSGFKSSGFFNNDSNSKREFFNNQNYNIRTNNQDNFLNISWNHSFATSPNNSNQRYIKSNSKNYNPRFDQNYDTNSSDGDLIANVESNKTLNFYSNKAKLSPQLPDQTTNNNLQQQQQLAPLSLREKRKNNEYESPLARISNTR